VRSKGFEIDIQRLIGIIDFGSLAIAGQERVHGPYPANLPSPTEGPGFGGEDHFV
jgi:hypothetical protein